MQGVFAQRLAPDGQKLGDEFRINQFTAYNQRSPALAALADGRFLAAWISEQQRFENTVDVYARLYDAAGSPAGNEFRVNTAETNVCANPFVAADGDGFMVAWSQLDMANPTNAWDVFARRYDDAGSALAAAFRVNSHVTRSQYAPQIATIGSERLIVWTSDGQDGSREGVFGRFLSGEILLGEDFEVNTGWQSQQIHPTIASDGSRRFVVVWSSFVGGAGSFELQAQVYAADTSLAAPAPPFVSALDQNQISVTWPELAGFTNVARYLLYVDSGAVPVSVTNNYHVIAGLMPASVHTFRLAFELTDGRTSLASAPVTSQTWARDGNFDGLPDDWQTQYWGTSPANWPGPQVDSDGDGATNIQEFLAGTDPTDPNSVLRIQISTTSQGPRVQWNTQPGLVYQIQASPDLSSWNNIGTLRFAPGTNDSMAVAGAGAAAYYRIIRMR
jgi:hypothetical protein